MLHTMPDFTRALGRFAVSKQGEASVASERRRGEDRAQDKSQEKSQVQVIARAAAILRALEEQPAGLSLGQIAQRVELARSTVQRIVAALAAEKLLIAASPTGRVRLGPTILRLAASARTDFVATARPFLVRLSDELSETVDLAAIKRDHLIFACARYPPSARPSRSTAPPTARPIWRSSTRSRSRG
jgi:DNA-binding IclR family transcriptional regulator